MRFLGYPRNVPYTNLTALDLKIEIQNKIKIQVWCRNSVLNTYKYPAPGSVY